MKLTNSDYEILIVDDNKANVDVIARLLDIEGYKTFTATSGEIALELVKNKIPDLIILDIHMPGMSGFDVCEILKADVNFKEIPIIFISAYTDTAQLLQGFQVGGLDYITKPFNSSEVKARIKTHLKLHNLKNELIDKNKELHDTLSDLKNTQDKLIESNKLASLSILAKGFAHEINNPINSINGSANTLKILLADLIQYLKKSDSLIANSEKNISNEISKLKVEYDIDFVTESFKDLLENITDASFRAESIIKGVREYVSEFETGSDSKFVLTDINIAIKLTLSIIDFLFADSISVTTNYGQINEIMCIPGKLNQVLMILIKNAVDSLHEKTDDQSKKIEIATFNEKFGLTIKITDNGIGIPQENFSKIFDPFFSTKEIGKGSGLGLSIAHGIMTSLGGEITFKSVIGQETSFFLHFPYKN